MFWKRLLSGALLLGVAIGILWLGRAFLTGAMCFVSLCALRELTQAFHLEDKLWYILGVIGVAAIYLSISFRGERGILGVVVFALVIYFVIYVLRYPKMKSWDILISFGLMLYVSLPLACLPLLSYLEQGPFLVWLVLISSWGADTGAYCVGSLMGKHKLVPKLSPGKSIEGAVGGVVISVLLSMALAYGYQCFGYTPLGNHTMIDFALITGLASILSIFGDLAASGIKRDHNLKDYADVIPGHGGIMDRFDSVLFTAPVVYYLSLLLIKF